jgi:hypothetical protein
MTQAAKRPSTATRRTGGSQATPQGYGPPGELDLRGEQDLVGDRDRDDGNDRNDRDDRTERDERNSDEQRQQRARSEQDARREDRADDRDERNERVEPDSRDQQQRTERGEQWHGDRGELGDGREPRREPGGVQRTLEQVTDRARSATPVSGDALAPTPDMSKVLTAWFDMAGDMMKLQQQFFSTVLGAENTDDRNTTKV